MWRRMELCLETWKREEGSNLKNFHTTDPKRKKLVLLVFGFLKKRVLHKLIFIDVFQWVVIKLLYGFNLKPYLKQVCV